MPIKQNIQARRWSPGSNLWVPKEKIRHLMAQPTRHKVSRRSMSPSKVEPLTRREVRTPAANNSTLGSSMTEEPTARTLSGRIAAVPAATSFAKVLNSKEDP